MENPTRDEMRTLVASIGGEDVLCTKLGASVRTLQSHYDARGFPAAWWKILSDMGRDAGVDVPEHFFRWKSATAA